MKAKPILLLVGATLVGASSLCAQKPATPPVYEPLPVLNASNILQPQFLTGPNFTVRNPVPTESGANQYTIDSDFGVFTADGNAMLMRRIAEIGGIAQLQALAKTDQFIQAAGQAALTPLDTVGDLVTNPVQTLSSVPRGIFGFLNRAGEAVKMTADGDGPGLGSGRAVSSLTGFDKTKRDISLKLGVDPYTTNEVYLHALSKVAWPVFLGKTTVNLGMAAVTGGAGIALSAVNWTGRLQDSLRDKSPIDLRLMNLGLMTDGMGIARPDADAFLNNSAISPTTQTIIVAALGQLGNIPGQAEFIRQATMSQSEADALTFAESVKIMAKLGASAPIASITHLDGLTVCQTNDGTVIVPIQWDYVAWTPGAAKFVAALKARKLATAATAYTVMINGLASPTTTQALAGLGVNLVTKALPGPLQ